MAARPSVGIAVVYVVTPQDLPLIQLHLAQIRRCTRVDYRVHAAVVRVPDGAREALEGPDVVIHDLPASERRGSLEHAGYLDQLLDRAADAGHTHLATLDVDSFPVREGWLSEWIARLDDQHPVAGVAREEVGEFAWPHPCGIVMTADFLRAGPARFLATELRASPEYADFMARHRTPDDTGTPLGLALERHGLEFQRVLRSDPRGVHPELAAIYGDALFHLGATARPLKHLSMLLVGEDGRQSKPLGWYYLRGRLADRVPGWVKRLLEPLRRPWEAIPKRPLQLLMSPQLRKIHRQHAALRAALLEDPEGFLARVRAGGVEPGAGAAAETRG